VPTSTTGGYQCSCNWSNRMTATDIIGEWHTYTIE
jgi:hypothetical protein